MTDKGGVRECGWDGYNGACDTSRAPLWMRREQVLSTDERQHFLTLILTLTLIPHPNPNREL